MRSSLSLAYKQIVDYLRSFHQGRDKLPTDLAEVSTEELEEKRSQLRQLYESLTSRLKAARGVLPSHELQEMERKIQENVEGEVEHWESILLDQISRTEETDRPALRKRRPSAASEERFERVRNLWNSILIGYQSARQEVLDYLQQLDEESGQRGPGKPREWDFEELSEKQDSLREKFRKLRVCINAVREAMSDEEADEFEDQVDRDIVPRLEDWLSRFEQWLEPAFPEINNSDRGSRGSDIEPNPDLPADRQGEETLEEFPPGVNDDIPKAGPVERNFQSSEVELGSVPKEGQSKDERHTDNVPTNPSGEDQGQEQQVPTPDALEAGPEAHPTEDHPEEEVLAGTVLPGSDVDTQDQEVNDNITSFMPRTFSSPRMASSGREDSAPMEVQPVFEDLNEERVDDSEVHKEGVLADEISATDPTLGRDPEKTDQAPKNDSRRETTGAPMVDGGSPNVGGTSTESNDVQEVPSEEEDNPNLR
ncbi:MAG TPA: hypothetical protein VH681_06930, partial [Nitrospiraceae bacterium]